MHHESRSSQSAQPMKSPVHQQRSAGKPSPSRASQADGDAPGGEGRQGTGLRLPPPTLDVPYGRRLPIGAEPMEDGGVHFRIWAPKCRELQVVLLDDAERELGIHSLERENGGYFSVHVPAAEPGTLYKFQIDGGQRCPDPASRFQPRGVHGPSEVIDPTRFEWTDADWEGTCLEGQVLYELHIGTFTPEGTYSAAIEKLPYLRDLGVTVIEVMPLADFHGEFGWGYDGVCWFAPTRLYGRPDDFRALVDAAHGVGLGVILDVVYNHFGPSGNYTGAYSPYYISRHHHTEWGDAVNFDGKRSGPVREFVAANTAYWIAEFHLDGLRFDATQAIFDRSPEHLLTFASRAARQAAGTKPIVLYAENDAQQVCHVEPPESGGYGMDGLWNDDFHHACRVAATGHAEFYYMDYEGSPQELLSAVRWGYLYQGQWVPRLQRRRGTPARHLAAARFVHFLQNHDQVANSARGLRTHLLTTPGRFRALTALLLLGPETPMLFMGQEFAASNPWLFFADHDVDLGQLVRQGRWEFVRRFPSAAGYSNAIGLPDPTSRQTFEMCKLNWAEVEQHEPVLRLHRELLALRRDDPVFARQDKRQIEGIVIGPESFLLRWFGGEGDDRLLLVNLGRDLHWQPAAAPLMAPPTRCDWHLFWSSEAPRYGGSGTAILDTKDWRIPGHAAILLKAVPLQQ